MIRILIIKIKILAMENNIIIVIIIKKTTTVIIMLETMIMNIENKIDHSMSRNKLKRRIDK